MSRFSENYPSHLVHGILSGHCADESGKYAGKSKIRVGDKLKFSTEKNLYKQMSERQLNLDSYMADWEVIKINDEKDNGYLGVVYCNKKMQQLVLVHRSTNFALGWTTENMLKGSGVQADFDGALKGRITSHQISGYVSTYEAIELRNSQFPEFTLSFTGHSLGAWLAALSVYYAQAEFGDKISKAVTFDGPGAKDMIEQMAAAGTIRGRGEDGFNIKDLDIISYVAPPNIVNCTNSHVGTLYRLFGEIPVPKEMGEKIQKIGGKSSLSIFGHDLSYILSSFDINSGKPVRCEQVVKWPSITCTGYDTSNPAARIRSIIPSGNQNTQNLLGWLTTTNNQEPSTLWTTAELFGDILLGRIKADQFWLVHEYLNPGKEYAVKSLTNIPQRFALAKGASYQTLESQFIRSKVIDMLDEGLKYIANTLAREGMLHLETPLTKLIKQIKDKYTIESHDQGEHIKIREQYKSDLSIEDLRDVMRVIHTRNKKDWEELPKLIIATHKITEEISNNYPVGKLIKILLLLAADEEVPVELLKQLSPPDSTQAGIWDIIHDLVSSEVITSDAAGEWVKITGIISQLGWLAVRNVKEMSEEATTCLNVINTKMPTFVCKSDAEFSVYCRDTARYHKHTAALLGHYGDIASDSVVVASLNSKLGIYCQYVLFDYNKAETHFKKALELENSSSNNLNLAALMLRLGNFDDAMKYAESALTLLEAKPEFMQSRADILDVKGSILRKIGSVAESRECIAEAFKIRVQNFDFVSTEMTHHNLAFSHSTFLTYEAAKKNLATMPKFMQPSYLNSYGVIALKAGEVQEAVKFFTKAMELSCNDYNLLSPDMIVSLENIANVYHNSKNFGKMLNCLELASKLREKMPQDSEINIAVFNGKLGLAYIEVGMIKDGIAMLEESIKVANLPKLELAYLYSNLAYAYQKQSDYKTSVAYNLEALKLLQAVYGANSNADLAKCYDNLATIELMSGKYPESKVHLMQSLELLGKLKLPLESCTHKLKLVEAREKNNTKGFLSLLRTPPQISDIKEEVDDTVFSIMLTTIREKYDLPEVAYSLDGEYSAASYTSGRGDETPPPSPPKRGLSHQNSSNSSNSNDISDPSCYLEDKDLASIAGEIPGGLGINFVQIDGNVENSVISFLSEEFGRANVKVAAINISGNGQPCGATQGNHWITYVECKQDNLIIVMILNSVTIESYGDGVNRIEEMVRYHYHKSNQPVTIEQKHLGYQYDGMPSCGVWVWEFLSKICEYITSTGSSGGVLDMLQSLEYDNPTHYINLKRLRGC
ncbi:MAG UNVERIFIED_CONTAM: tetratricopeptide repeat protein [Rickettsiaceae bacterium]|jgi:tetratricopeptide (TPR) repeat protein